MRDPIEHENAFKAYLEAQHFQGGQRVVSDTIARCRRINDDLDDLDAAYRNDRCADMLRRLTYTADDARHHVPPPAGLDFKKQPGDPEYYQSVKECLASLRSALRLYLEFREEKFRKDANPTGPSAVNGPNGGAEDAPAAGTSGVSASGGQTPKASKMSFSEYLDLYHDWLIEEEEVKTKGSADSYKCYVKALAKACDAMRGKGWFEALPSDYENTRSSERIVQCFALIENMVLSVPSNEGKKNWRNWHSAFHAFERFLYDITDTYCADLDNGAWDVASEKDLPPAPAAGSALPPQEPTPPAKGCDDTDGAVIATYSREDLVRTFMNRLKTQGRYYPAHGLLFPTRLLTKIFRGQKDNAWTAWLKEGIARIRVRVSDTDFVPFSDVKELTIRGGGAVFVDCGGKTPRRVWTAKASGGARAACALRGVRDLSLDHVVALENVIGAQKENLAGLKKLTELFSAYKKARGENLDERSEYVWVKEFFKQYRADLETAEMRALLKQDLEVLDFRYELMETRENTLKGKK